MGEHLIITIVREFGAEGHEIGKKLSNRLKINLYDKDLLQKASRERDIYSGSLQEIDEKVTDHFMAPYAGFGITTDSLNDTLFRAEQQVIHELAEKESCIIIGRLSDYILRDEPKCLKVFIFAPLEFRIDLIKNKYSISEAAAKKLIKKMDAARNEYYNYYSNGRWKRDKNKDLMLNRGTFSVENCVDILEAMAKTMEGGQDHVND